MDSTNFSASDCSSDAEEQSSTVDKASMLYRSGKNGVELLEYKSYGLRKKPAFINENIFQNEKSMIDDFCKLVCKPVTVTLTRLADSELRRLTTKVLPKPVPIKKTPVKRPLFRFYGRGKKKRKNTVNTEECGKDCKQIPTQTQSNEVNKTVDNNVKNVQKKVYENVLKRRHRLQVPTASTIEEPSNDEQCKEDLSKIVKQPIITLSRIDEVINKLAQSFARVATNKQNHTVEQPLVKQNITVSRTEEIESTTSSNTSECSLNEQVDDNISDTDSDDVSQIRWTSRRKRKLFWNSSDESDTDQLREETSIQTKMLKLSSPQKETADTNEKSNELHRYTPLQIKRLKFSLPQKEIVNNNETCNELLVELHTTNEEEENTASSKIVSEHLSSQIGMSPKICVSNKLHGLYTEESIETGIVNGEALVEDEEVNAENNKVIDEEEDLDIESIESDNIQERIDVESTQVVEAQQEADVTIEDFKIETDYVDVEHVDADIDIVNLDVDVESDEVDVEVENTRCSLDASDNAVQESTKNITEDSVPSLLLPEVDVVHTCTEHTSSKPADESVREATEMQQHGSKRSVSANEFAQKYKLHKQAKILLVDLQHIRSSCGNKYSAMEVEKLIQRNINSSPNCNSTSTTQNLLIPAAVSLEHVVGRSKTDNNIATSNLCSIESTSNVKSTHSNKFSSSENIIRREGNVERERSSHNVLKKGKLHKMTSDGAIGHSISSHFPKQSIRELGLSSGTKSTTKTPSSSPQKSGQFSTVLKSTESAAKEKATSGNSDTVASKNSSNIIKNLHIAGHSSYAAKDLSKNVIVGDQKTDAKKTTLTCVPITSSTKHKKLTEKKDSSISEESSNNYKCIVCDLYFEDYSVLQQHLSKHAKQQIPSSSPTYTVAERRGYIDEMIESPPPTVEKQALPQSLTDTIICEVGSPSNSIADQNVSPTETTSLNKKLQKKSAKSKSGLPRKKICKPCILTNKCSVCSQEFSTRADLAAHIFLHTESELQVAYETAKQKIHEDTAPAESETEKTQDIVTSAVDSVEKSSTNTIECEISSSKAPTAQNQNEPTPDPVEVNVPVEVNISGEVNVSGEVNKTDPKTSKPTDTENSSNNQVSSVINKGEKAKPSRKGGSSKTLFTICQCHNRSDVNFSCLQIEIVLLCHTCRVLFRSMECFETHYRLPEYSTCNQNRLESGRSSNLFCATCGMIFCSVQDVRQHLEMHIRFKKYCTMDFRCNICKVVFIGIGSLFYLHWYKHTKDPYWVASEQSFPKISVFSPKSMKPGVTYKPGEFIADKYLDNFIYIAEYVCFNCKVTFVNEDHLKTHLLNCKADSPTEIQTVQPDGTETIQFELDLICSLCAYSTFSRVELYAHMKDTHKFVAEQQFVRVSLTSLATTFICSICMEICADSYKFNEHWLRHYVKQPYFVCIYCDKYNACLDTFKEHVKEHVPSIKDNIVSCKVKYRCADYICKICNIAVESEKLLRDHSVIHYPNNWKNKNDNGIVSQKSMLCARRIEKKSDKADKTTAEQTVGCSKSDADLDKQKLISILEGNEDEDSDNDLVIDLTEKSENESGVKDRSREKQVALTLSTPILPTPMLPSTTSNATSDSGTQVTPQNVVQSKEESDVKNGTKKDGDSNKEAVVTSLTNQKYGFLRVKALTELLKDTSSLFMCKVCNYSCESAENLRQHHSTHITEKQPQPSQPEVPVSQKPASSAKESKSVNNSLPGKKSTATGRTVQIPLLTTLYPGTATNAKAVGTKPNPGVSSAQASTKTGYHKNLPPCNIVRKIIVRRNAIEPNEKAATSMATDSTNAQSTQTASTAEFNSINQRGPVNTATNSNKYPSGNLPSTVNTASMVANNYNNNTYTKQCSNNSMLHDLLKYPQAQQLTNGVAVRKSHNIGDGVARSNEKFTNDNQNCIQTQHTVQNQERMTPTTTVYYQYMNSEPPYTGNDQRPMQGRQVIQQVPNPTVTRNVGNMAPAFYYKNPSSGGMSIVINQAPATVQSLPAMDLRQQQGHQSPIYQPVYTNPVVSADSYVQQSPQNIIDYTGTGEVYQVTSNEYAGPISENVTACERTLQSSQDLICPYCPTPVTFTNQDMFELHISISHNFICDICGLSFFNIDDIRIHKIKHGLM